MVVKEEPTSEPQSDLEVFSQKIKDLKVTFKENYLTMWRHLLCDFQGDRLAMLEEGVFPLIEKFRNELQAANIDGGENLIKELSLFETQSRFAVDLLRAQMQNIAEVREQFQKILQTI